MFCCPCCSRTYQRKIYYDRHYNVCQLLAQTKRTRELNLEESSDTPSLRDLYLVVMEMTAKYNKLEQKMNNLLQLASIKKQKVDLIVWLNQTYTEANPFLAWLGEIKTQRKHLECIFNLGYNNGMNTILKQFIAVSDERRPLRAFKSRDSVLYAQLGPAGWLVLENDMFIKIVHILDKQCMKEFVLWQNENIDNLSKDSFANTYALNLKKMMGDDFTQEQISQRIKRELYNYLQEALPDEAAV